MKSFILLLFLSCSYCFGDIHGSDILDFNIIVDIEDHNEWEEHPDEFGNRKKVNLKELDVEYSNLTTKEFLVTFCLYTRLNPKIEQIIRINDTESLLHSNFNKNHPTRFITHGWMNDGNSSVNKLIRDAYLNHSDYNIFVVDWGSTAHYKWYYFSARKVEFVGEKIAEFIDFLYKYGNLSFSNLTLIGHSLGAHASGLAGKKVKNGKIHTIIGLDPAAPWFTKQNSNKRLSSTDAEYVETIHTDINYFGFKEPLGIASFYPNWGEAQPECHIDIGGCSHGRSYQYFAESIKSINRNNNNIENNNNYLVVKCRNYFSFLLRSCHIFEFGLKMGGEPSNHGKAKGIYFVDVDNQINDPLGGIIV